MKRQVPLLVATVVLLGIVAGLSGSAAASQVYPVTGTWNGNMTGTGTYFAVKITVTLTFDGTFEGNTQQGVWKGTYDASYEAPAVSIKGQEVGPVDSKYTMSVDDSGVVSGQVTQSIEGIVTGELELKLQGTESESGDVKGTWSGTLTVSQVKYKNQMLTLDKKMAMEGTGSFQGKETRTTTATGPITTTASPAVAPTSTTPPPTTGVAPTETGQYLPYIIGVIAIVIILGIVAYWRRSGAQRSKRH
jgi:hypothetical protein